MPITGFFGLLKTAGGFLFHSHALIADGLHSLSDLLIDFMVIIGGMGSIMGSFFGAAFIVILPIFLNQALPWVGSLVGVTVSTAMISHAEFMIFGGLIVWFLIAEPHGLAKLWSIGKQKLRLWPFPH